MPDQPVDRRRDARVAQVERRLVHGGLAGLDLRGFGVARRFRVVELLLADGLLRGQRCIARHVVLRFFEPRLGRRQFGLRCRQDRFERLAIDFVKKIALADERAFPEVHRLEETLDTCPDVDVLEALGLPDELQVDRHVPLDDVGDVHLGRRCHDGRRLLARRAHSGDDYQDGEHRPACIGSHVHVRFSVYNHRAYSSSHDLRSCWGGARAAGGRIRQKAGVRHSIHGGDTIPPGFSCG